MHKERKLEAHFFEDRHDVERFREDLESGEIPLKWAYSGSAAITHDALGKSEGYNSNSNASVIEARLISALESIASRAVDIGPGNSLHTEHLWSQIEPSRRPARYLLLDFSDDLLAICKSRLEQPSSSLVSSDISAAKWDFEVAPTHAISEWRGDEPVMAMLLGHTIGNPVDPYTVLGNIRNSLRRGDHFLLSLSIRSDDRTALASYSESLVFRTAATEPFRMAGIGVSPDDLLLSIDEDGTILGTVLLPSEVSSHTSREVVCFRSRRFQPQEAHTLIAVSYTI